MHDQFGGEPRGLQRHIASHDGPGNRIGFIAGHVCVQAHGVYAYDKGGRQDVPATVPGEHTGNRLYHVAGCDSTADLGLCEL